MKQVKFLAVAVVLVIAGMSHANAQKLGTVDFEGLVSLLPEAKTVEEKLNKYRNDTINAELVNLVKEIKEKDSLSKDPKNSPSVKKVLEEKLQQLQSEYANFNNAAGQAMQYRQNALMQPLIEKVRAAITAVAKEKGFQYVLAPDAFYVIPPTDDLTKAVADKLGVKIPVAPAGAPAAK